MNLQEVIQFANQNPVCYLATMDGDQPRVRTVLMVKADENGFYFALLSPKHVVKQIQANPKAEAVFYNNASDLGLARQMRVTGIMELDTDEALHKKVATDRAFLAQLAGYPVEPLIVIYRLCMGEAVFWTMPDILKEDQLERVKI